MQARIDQLESEVTELKAMAGELQSASQPQASDQATTAATSSPQQQNLAPSTPTADDRTPLDFLRDTTLNLSLNTYYSYHFNHPVGRVNLLRACDVLSNEFSLNQASVILEHAPNLDAGRRWGARLDLQFGHATNTWQGNLSDEPRPQIYRNTFQAYGTYVVPVDKDINLDFGKWSRMYSRWFWFYFLPFCHLGVRASIPVNDRFSLNYWLVNGTNHVEATNGFKDELFGFTAKPAKALGWTLNYCLGQEHPDRLITDVPTNPVPVQQGLNFVPSGSLRMVELTSSTAISPGKRLRGSRLRLKATTLFSGYGRMRVRVGLPQRHTWMEEPPTSPIPQPLVWSGGGARKEGSW